MTLKLHLYIWSHVLCWFWGFSCFFFLALLEGSHLETPTFIYEKNARGSKSLAPMLNRLLGMYITQSIKRSAIVIEKKRSLSCTVVTVFAFSRKRKNLVRKICHDIFFWQNWILYIHATYWTKNANNSFANSKTYHT